MQSIQGEQLVAFWCFGIIECLNWLAWKEGSSQFRADSKTVRMVFHRCLLVYMVLCAEGKWKTSMMSWRQ